MGEVEFALITVALVILISFLANRILSKKIVRKKQLPAEEDFIGNPNNLNKIIEGVSLKQKNDDVNKLDNSNLNIEEENLQDSNNEGVSMIEKNRSEATKRINLKDAVISKEILNKKF
ncbi:MAG: hypothetical protein JXR68_13245 [Bacteroidales bacterium]|nr:hypothetical protein [Bacteroidales bacterium]